MIQHSLTPCAAPRPRRAVAWWVLLFCACAAATLGAEDEPVPPILEGHLPPKGEITFWLMAPPVRTLLENIEQPPAAVVEGGASPAGAPWKRYVSAQPFMTLRPHLGGASKGTVWLATRLASTAGGKRTVTVSSYCGVQVWLDGKAVLQKPAPADTQSNTKTAVVELPKGEVLLVVAASIRWGHCGLMVGLTDGNGLKPAEGDTVRVPLAAGTSLKDARASALADGMTWQPRTYFVQKGRVVELSLGLLAGWPAGVEAIKPRLLDFDGKVFKTFDEARAPDDIRRKPWQAAYTVPADTPATFDLACEYLEGETVVARKTLTLYAPGAILQGAMELEQQMAAAPGGSARHPHAALAVDKVKIWFERLQMGAERLTPEVGHTLAGLLEDGKTWFRMEQDGEDPFEGRTGYLERAYTSPIDEKAQPYYLVVPEAAREELAKPRAERTKKFPLIVFLHGYVPTYNKHRWWTEMPLFNEAANRAGAFMVIPFGRSNTDFLGAGEVDVLDAMADVEKHYPIDDDRVYLYGYSMGGMAAYSLGGHYPDRWAAAVVMAGRAYSPVYMYHATLQDKAAAQQAVHPFKRLLIRADQPMDLVENFAHIPTRIYHGKDDTIIHPAEATLMVNKLKEFGCEADLKFMPGDHWFGFDLMEEDEPITWLLQHKRASAPTGRRKGYSLRFMQRKPIGVFARTTAAQEPFHLAWQRGEAGFTVTQVDGPVGVLSWGEEFAAPPQWATPALKARFEKEGAQVSLASPDKVVAALGAAGMAKTPVRCGPVKEATYGPFVVVYGTTGGAKSAARLKEQAQLFAREWYAFTKSHAIVKADTELTDGERLTKNLWLIGEEQENSIHAELARTGKLPFSVKDGQVGFDGRQTPLKDRGLLYIYPNPLSGARPSCSVVIEAGLHYGQHLPENHKLDLVPDFLLFTAEKDADFTGTNKPLLAGFFDGQWKTDPRATWWFLKEKNKEKKGTGPAPQTAPSGE